MSRLEIGVMVNTYEATPSVMVRGHHIHRQKVWIEIDGKRSLVVLSDLRAAVDAMQHQLD